MEEKTVVIIDSKIEQVSNYTYFVEDGLCFVRPSAYPTDDKSGNLACLGKVNTEEDFKNLIAPFSVESDGLCVEKVNDLFRGLDLYPEVFYEDNSKVDPFILDKYARDLYTVSSALRNEPNGPLAKEISEGTLTLPDMAHNFNVTVKNCIYSPSKS